MSYYSRIGIMCGHIAYEMFEKVWKEYDFEPDKIYRMAEDEDLYYFEYDESRWYGSDFEFLDSIPEIEATMNILKGLDRLHDRGSRDGYEYTFFRLGDESSDVERRRNETLDLFLTFDHAKPTKVIKEATYGLTPKEILRNQIGELADAFQKVYEAIEVDSDFDVFICDEYPFDKSFDEVMRNVSQWYETMREKVEKDSN